VFVVDSNGDLTTPTCSEARQIRLRATTALAATWNSLLNQVLARGTVGPYTLPPKSP